MEDTNAREAAKSARSQNKRPFSQPAQAVLLQLSLEPESPRGGLDPSQGRGTKSFAFSRSVGEGGLDGAFGLEVRMGVRQDFANSAEPGTTLPGNTEIRCSDFILRAME